MARDSCNHTAPGSLQESLSVPVPHLSALLGRKGHKVNQQKEYKLSEASLPGLPEFTLIQWISRNPASSRLRHSGKEQQGGGDGHRVGSDNCEKVGSSGT